MDSKESFAQKTIPEEKSVCLEMRFPIMGKSLPSDHGYVLFSAISHLLPEIHKGNWLALDTIPGMKKGKGIILLKEHPLLKIRLPQDYIALILKLSGKQLDLEGHKIRLGIPQIFGLIPATSLYARCVTLKNHTQPESFRKAIPQKLKELNISAEIEIGPRRAFRVSNHKIIGFSLTIHQLNEENSLTLQENGLGGRRHMGCGFFQPTFI